MAQLPLDFTKPQPDVRFRYRLELAEEEVPYDEEVRLTRPGEIVRFLVHRVFCREPREVFAVLFVDVRLALIGHQIAYTGSLHRVLADPQQIFAAALLHNAAGIIVAHNHPSGCLEPSGEDLRTTDRLEKGGEILGIRLHDHLIVAPDGRWLSLRGTACCAAT